MPSSRTNLEFRPIIPGRNRSYVAESLSDPAIKHFRIVLTRVFPSIGQTEEIENIKVSDEAAAWREFDKLADIYKFANQTIPDP